MSNEKNVYILSGLPGSGKTYYANKLQQKEKKGRVFIFSQDEKIRWDTYYSNVFQINTIIVDGLNLTNDSIIETIKDVKKNIRLPKDWNFTIVRWNEDRDTCLKNDKDRREKNSAKTIKNTVFEELDLEKIKKETKLKEIHVIKETVKLKQDYLANVKNPKKYNIKGNYLISDEWILGGTSRSYDADWNNVYYPMFADETPDFTELDDYLEEIYPTISFLTYKKIKKECVDVEQYIDRDYYSTTENAYYRCNLEKMFEIIKEMQE